MQSTLYNTELWLDYSAEMRALSWTMTDPDVRELLLTAALGFEYIAQLSGLLGQAKPPTGPNAKLALTLASCMQAAAHVPRGLAREVGAADAGSSGQG
jgi:hypothetical protein